VVFQPRKKQHTFDGGQEGDGGLDNTVAQQQRGADEGEKAVKGKLPAGFDRLAENLPRPRSLP